jgi:hypothetical protein
MGALVLLAQGCASTRVVRPIGRGQTELSAGLGGPLSHSYKAANPPPVPSTTLGARRGISERVDVFVDAHVNAWVFGVTWLDAGGSYALLPCGEQGYCLLVSSATHVLTNFEDTVALQQLTGVASVRFGRVTPYLGWDTVFQLLPARDHMPIPFAGLRVDVSRYFVQGELRWYAPFADGERATSQYISPGGAGALGASLTLGGRL